MRTTGNNCNNPYFEILGFVNHVTIGETGKRDRGEEPFPEKNQQDD